MPIWRGARRGTTLLEALVAVGVLVMLLGISLPVLGRARDEAKSAECLSHLRHLGVAARSYATVHRDRYPPAVLYFAEQGTLVTHAWDFRHRGGEVSAGALRGFTDRPEHVQQCPCCLDESTFGNDPATGYNYNTSFIGAEGRLPYVAADGTIVQGFMNARLGLPIHAHRKPSQTAVLGDGGWAGGANKFMRAPSNSVEQDWGTVYAGGQSFRHAGRTNVSWLDGSTSTEATAHEGPMAGSNFATQILGFAANGFLSEDDSAYDPR